MAKTILLPIFGLIKFWEDGQLTTLLFESEEKRQSYIDENMMIGVISIKKFEYNRMPDVYKIHKEYFYH